MKFVKKIIFSLYVFAFLSGLTVYVLQQKDFPLPKFIQNHYNDLVVMPLVLGASLWVARKVKSQPSLRLTLFQCLSMAMLYSYVFEVFLPKINSRYTADLLDVFFYFIGATLFYCLQKIKYQSK
jgi:hypothetical protein